MDTHVAQLIVGRDGHVVLHGVGRDGHVEQVLVHVGPFWRVHKDVGVVAVGYQLARNSQDRIVAVASPNIEMKLKLNQTLQQRGEKCPIFVA